MRKLISLLAIFAAGIGFSACSASDEEPPAGNEDWSFVVIGDIQQGYGIYGNLAKQIGQILPVPCATFICGDIMLRAGNEVEWLNFHRYSSPIASKMPVYIARGNHDGNDPGSEQVFRDNTSYTGEEFYAAYNFNGSAFIILDTESRVEKWSVSGNQLIWLVNQLDSATANKDVDNVFIIMHHPPYPQGMHHNEILNNADELHALFLSYSKVRAVFAGHDHIFNKYIRDGFPYITTGGGGAILQHGYGGDYFHFTKVSIYEDTHRINIRTTGIFSETVDDFDL
jgi:3',5'-cyclic AMP phosphodiesterase CpdA